MKVLKGRRGDSVGYFLLKECLSEELDQLGINIYKGLFTVLQSTLVNSMHNLILSHITITIIPYTVEPVLSCHSKLGKTKVLYTNGSLMKVESIAECSREHSAILMDCIKRKSVLKIILGLLFERPLKTGFTVYYCNLTMFISTTAMSIKPITCYKNLVPPNYFNVFQCLTRFHFIRK